MTPLIDAGSKGDGIKDRQKIAFRKLFFAILIACIIVSIYSYSIVSLNWVQTLRFRFEDFAFQLRHKYYSTIGKDYVKVADIVLVAIDEESYKQLGKRWPWTRDVFADFLNKLAEYHPKVIALDFALYGQNQDNPDIDARLAEAIRKCGNVIITSVYGREKLYLGPYDIFAKVSAGSAVIGAVKDADNAVRRVKTYTPIFSPQKTADFSFEIKTAARYLDVPYNKISKKRKGILLMAKDRNIEIPTDKDGYILINYLSDTEDIYTVPIWKVIADGLPRNMLEGKVVLVTQTGEVFHNLYLTPFGFRSSGLIIANVLNSIISSSYIRTGNSFFFVPIIWLIYALGFILFYKTSLLRGFFILIFTVTTYLTTAFLFFLNGIILPTFHVAVLLPLLFLGITFYKYTEIVFEGTEIKRLAITDSLTGLYTHRYFRFLLEHTVNKTLSFGNKCSLIVIKILNLDRIVKELSFDRGKSVQKRVAELIKMKLSKDGAGAYLGMGEFSMLLPNVGLYEALGIAGSLRDNIRKTDFIISYSFLKPIVAIGVSAVNPGGFPKTGIELMRGARVAMARAREIGYDRICRFNPAIDSFVFEPAAIEREIKQRLDDEFSFFAIDLEERNKELEDLLRQLSVAQKDLEEAHFETLRSLVIALEQKDPCTAGHSERVGECAEKIGRKLRMPEEELRFLKQAGVLHDIGKVGIPQDILRKEEILDSSEKQIVALHPEFSVRILNTSKYFNKIIHAIRDHHERLDGSGYPRGLKGNQISLEAQIIAVCDTFDAMTGDRPYRKAFSSKEALDEILSNPERYNQTVALALKGILEEEHS